MKLNEQQKANLKDLFLKVNTNSNTILSDINNELLKNGFELPDIKAIRVASYIVKTAYGVDIESTTIEDKNDVRGGSFGADYPAIIPSNIKELNILNDVYRDKKSKPVASDTFTFSEFYDYIEPLTGGDSKKWGIIMKEFTKLLKSGLYKRESENKSISNRVKIKVVDKELFITLLDIDNGEENLSISLIEIMEMLCKDTSIERISFFQALQVATGVRNYDVIVADKKAKRDEKLKEKKEKQKDKQKEDKQEDSKSDYSLDDLVKVKDELMEANAKLASTEALILGLKGDELKQDLIDIINNIKNIVIDQKDQKEEKKGA